MRFCFEPHRAGYPFQDNAFFINRVPSFKSIMSYVVYRDLHSLHHRAMHDQSALLDRKRTWETPKTDFFFKNTGIFLYSCGGNGMRMLVR
jgi:hypothetical protein